MKFDTTFTLLTALALSAPSFAAPAPAVGPISLPIRRHLHPDAVARLAKRQQDTGGASSVVSSSAAASSAPAATAGDGPNPTASGSAQGNTVLNSIPAIDVAALVGRVGETLYSVPAQIGLPGQQMDMLIGTDNPFVYVYASNCTGCGASSLAHFDADKSRSFTPDDNTEGWESFGPRQASKPVGFQGRDIVQIGQNRMNKIVYALDNGQVKSPNTPSAAGEEGGNTAVAGVGGILGLGWTSSSGEKSFSYDASSAWAEPQFGMYFKRSNSGTLKGSTSSQWVQPVRNDGEITFGGLNSSYYGSNPMTYVESKTSNWTITLDNVTIADKAVLKAPVSVRVSTGSSACILPMAVVEGIASAAKGMTESVSGSTLGLPGKLHVALVPCSSKTSISFTFGGTAFSIDPSELTSGGGVTNTNNGKTTETDKCLVPIYGVSSDSFSIMSNGSVDTSELPKGMEYSIGLPFLHNVYTAFRYEPPAVGFAKLADGVYNPVARGGAGALAAPAVGAVAAIAIGVLALA